MKTFPMEVVLSISTGLLLCTFPDMLEAVEYLVGSPVFTHQFAYKPFVDEVAESVMHQCPKLREVDASGVTPDNWKEWVNKELARLGTTVDLAPMSEVISFRESFTEPLRGKPTLILVEPSRGTVISDIAATNVVEN